MHPCCCPMCSSPCYSTGSTGAVFTSPICGAAGRWCCGWWEPNCYREYRPSLRSRRESQAEISMADRIAFFTLGVLRAPVGHREVQGFVDCVEKVYAAAEGSL